MSLVSVYFPKLMEQMWMCWSLHLLKMLERTDEFWACPELSVFDVLLAPSAFLVLWLHLAKKLFQNWYSF